MIENNLDNFSDQNIDNPPHHIQEDEVPKDIRRYIQYVLNSRCKRNPCYSLRAFAASLTLDHSSLSQVIRGKRTIGPKTKAKLIEKLKLGPEEQRLFFSAETSKISEGN